MKQGRMEAFAIEMHDSGQRNKIIELITTLPPSIFVLEINRWWKK